MKTIDAKEFERPFDVWEYPQKCEGCGGFDNRDENEPTCYLDANTKLCEFCFFDMGLKNEKRRQ